MVVGIPPWASDPPGDTGLPDGLYEPFDSPTNTWASFVRSLAARYAGRINHWTIWNEPSADGATAWNGTIEDLVQLVRVSYYAIKQANPDAVIHLPAFDDSSSLSFQSYLETASTDSAAYGRGYYFDVATIHAYFQPERLYEIPVSYRELMQEYWLDHPIWIVETNALPSDDPASPAAAPQFEVTLEQQASYVVQAAALAIAGGAERIAIYRMADAPDDDVPTGLVRSDGTRRPAFTAYQAAITHMAGFRSATWEEHPEYSLVSVDRGEQTTSVIWARTAEPQLVLIPAQTTRALLADSSGGAHIVYPERGYYLLELSGCLDDTGCAIGGAPLMLVEQNIGGSNAPPLPPSPTAPVVFMPNLPSPTPAPTYTPTPAATPTPLPTPTPSPTLPPTSTPTPSPTHTPTPRYGPPSTSPTTSRLAGPLSGILIATMLTAGLAFLRRQEPDTHNTEAGEPT
jgi:hypothetical protein